MLLIQDIVRQALSTGWLSYEAEQHLRTRLQSRYTNEDFAAFMKLQRAVMRGHVKQETREHHRHSKAENSFPTLPDKGDRADRAESFPGNLLLKKTANRFDDCKPLLNFAAEQSPNCPPVAP